MVSLADYVRDGGGIGDPTARIMAWLDTLTCYPDFSGGYFTDSVVWHATVIDTLEFPHVAPPGPPNDYVVFAVRGVSHGGWEEIVRPRNTRFFSILP
ncbi:MAG: hypothetical protein U0167_13650 [bacterium]